MSVSGLRVVSYRSIFRTTPCNSATSLIKRQMSTSNQEFKIAQLHDRILHLERRVNQIEGTVQDKLAKPPCVNVVVYKQSKPPHPECQNPKPFRQL